MSCGRLQAISCMSHTKLWNTRAEKGDFLLPNRVDSSNIIPRNLIDMMRIIIGKNVRADNLWSVFRLQYSDFRFSSTQVTKEDINDKSLCVRNWNRSCRQSYGNTLHINESFINIFFFVEMEISPGTKLVLEKTVTRCVSLYRPCILLSYFMTISFHLLSMSSSGESFFSFSFTIVDRLSQLVETFLRVSSKSKHFFFQISYHLVIFEKKSSNITINKILFLNINLLINFIMMSCDVNERK